MSTAPIVFTLGHGWAAPMADALILTGAGVIHLLARTRNRA